MIEMSEALRMRDVWLAHRDKLARYCAVSDGSARTHYSTINRLMLTKAIRALVVDMDAAQERDGGTDG